MPHHQADRIIRATFYALAPAPTDANPPPSSVVEPQGRSFDVVASTDAMDRVGRIVMQDWDLSTYQMNPVVYWNHAEGSSWCGDCDDLDITLPIGFASNVRVDGNRLLATINFVDAAANPLAEKVYQGMRQGSIRAVSVGWISHDVRCETHDELEVIVCAKNELLEISPVAIPANPDAVRTEGARFAASLRNLMKGTTMPSKLAASLRLKASASDEEISSAVDDIVSACEALKALIAPDSTDQGSSASYARKAASVLTTLIAASGASNANELVAKVALLSDAERRASKAEAEIASLRMEKVEGEIASIVKEATAAGKFTPGNKATLLRAIGGDENGKGCNVESLKALVAGLTVSANKSHARTEEPQASMVEMTGEQIDECKRRGVDPAKYAESRARVIASLDGGVR